MNTRRILLLALCGLCLSGCKSGKRNQELLERELRCQEDHIYELEDALDQCECELESARRENQTLKKDGAGSDPVSGKSSNVPIIDLPSDPARPKRGGHHDDPVLPTVEPGEEFIPPPSTPGASNRPEPTDRRIARIVLNKQLTGGLSHKRQGVDEGIMVVFEPRNARGEMVAEPGDVSIALVDPDRAGPEARVARWDFAASEAFEQFHRSGALGRGYEFELPWPDAAPQNKKLQLFVRYVAPDGRKLMSEMTISVKPPASNQADNWRTPAGGVAETPRRRLFRSGADRAPRDSEAPRFSSAGKSQGGSEASALPSVELGEESTPDESDGPTITPDEERPAAVARRPSSDRKPGRPAWTPYR